MSRDTKGRFSAGCSGNPRGRPRKEKRNISDTQLWRDILLSFEEEVRVTLDGKSVKMPAILLIHKHMVRRAIAGNERCMFKVIELRRQAILALLEQRLKLGAARNAVGICAA